MKPRIWPIDTFARLTDECAFTLIEAMMALAVTAIIVGAGLGVLVASEKATHTSGQIIDAQQSVRLAMELIARDIKVDIFQVVLASAANADPLIRGGRLQAVPSFESDD